jgi:hypothetical protein
MEKKQIQYGEMTTTDLFLVGQMNFQLAQTATKMIIVDAMLEIPISYQMVKMEKNSCLEKNISR